MVGFQHEPCAGWGASDVLSAAKRSREAEQAETEAQAKIRATFRDLGIPEAWAPGISCGWYGRGENASDKRRVELRHVATAEAERRLPAAETEIKRRSVEAEERVTIAGLSSEAARAMLETLPTPAQLLPELEFEAIERIAAPDRTGC